MAICSGNPKTNQALGKWTYWQTSKACCELHELRVTCNVDMGRPTLSNQSATPTRPIRLIEHRGKRGLHGRNCDSSAQEIVARMWFPHGIQAVLDQCKNDT